MNNEIIVLEISGESCRDCITLMPILRKILNNRSDAILKHIDAGKETEELIRKLNIDRFPTILVMKGNQEIARARGYQPEEILEIWLDAKIDEAKKY